MDGRINFGWMDGRINFQKSFLRSHPAETALKLKERNVNPLSGLFRFITHSKDQRWIGKRAHRITRAFG
jgi:hypothetical protein